MGKYSIVTIMIVLLLSACSPTISVNPLSSPAGIDERLEGAWKYKSEKDAEVYLHIGKKSDTTMLALSVELKNDGELDIIHIPFFLTKTGMNNYLNIKLEDLKEEVSEGYKGYVFIKYVFMDNDTLHLYSYENEPIISAIKANRLKGKIKYEKEEPPKGKKSEGIKLKKTIDCVIITDTSENMIKFFDSDKDNKIFSNELKFVRIK
jgi:hypothetical protein